MNSIRIARIMIRRFNGGPGLVVPHGVVVPHGLDVGSRSSVSSCTTSASSIVGSSSGLTSTDCATAAASISSRRASPSDSARCGARALHGPRRERVVRDDLRVRFAREAARATEVVGVRVRDDHGVDVLDAVAGGLQPRLQRLPRLRTGQAGVDDGDARCRRRGRTCSRDRGRASRSAAACAARPARLR